MEGTRMNINKNITLWQKQPQHTNIKQNAGKSCFTYMKSTGVEVNVCVKYWF